MAYRIAPTHKKADVDYSKGMPEAHCSICRFYHEGLYKDAGRCEKVKGTIGADMWCKLFRKK